jgi:hypothetical protein
MREYRDPLDAAHARIAQLERLEAPEAEIAKLRAEVRSLRSAVARERSQRNVWLVAALLTMCLVAGYLVRNEMERRAQVQRAWEKLGTNVGPARAPVGRL